VLERDEVEREGPPKKKRVGKEEKTLTAGTWMISTLISPAKEFGPACCDDVATKVLVRDVSAPQLTGITRR
jgi:hypothetical protein